MWRLLSACWSAEQIDVVSVESGALQEQTVNPTVNAVRGFGF